LVVLVTGATGFIGRNICIQLSKNQNIDVIISGRNEQTLIDFAHEISAEYLCFDISEKKADWFTFCKKPDILLHLSWGNLDNFKSLNHITNELPNHLRFLSSMINGGLKSLTVAGTCLEYGLIEGQVTEDMVTNPTTAYGIAKDTLRKALETVTSDTNIKLTWMRYFYMYGTGQSKKSILPLLEEAISKDDSQFKMSGGEQIRDYLSIEKVVAYTIALMLSNSYGIFNISSNTPISITTLVEERKKELHSSIELVKGVYPYTDYEPMNFWGDNSKLMDIVTKC